MNRVYNYGCKAPTLNREIVDKQVYLGNQYYDKLIDIHNAHHAALEAIRRKRYPEYDAITQAAQDAKALVNELVEKIRLANAAAKRKRCTDEEAAELKAAKKANAQAWAARQVLRTQVNADDFMKEKFGVLGAQKEIDLKAARAACGLVFGTYLKTEQAVEMAIETAEKWPLKKRKGVFGSGLISVQVQLGNTWQDMLDRKAKIKTLFRVVQMEQRGKHKCDVVTFQMRVGSDPQKHPIWTEFRCFLHRPLPADAVITWVTLVRKHRGAYRQSDGTWKQQYVWNLQFTLRTEIAKERASREKACGVDLGWRVTDDGLRVAYWADEDGNHGELKIPNAVLSGWSKAEELQATRDLNFNTVRAQLKTWMAGVQAQIGLPQWFTEATKHIGFWKNKGNMVRVIHEMDKHTALPGSSDIYQALVAWRVQDCHLWQWELAMIKKSQRRRKHQYREFVAKLRERYTRIAVEDCDWRKLAKDKPVTSNEFDPNKYWMRISSIGMLRELLRQDGAIFSKTEFTTMTCHVCGSIEVWDQAKELVHTCSECQSTWDQDFSAARNLLKQVQGAALPPPVVDPEAEEKKKGRWNSRKDKKKLKEEEKKKKEQDDAGDEPDAGVA